MKIKKLFFLWLFLAVMFFCVKIDASMLKIQSDYFNFNPDNYRFYTEVFMPYSEENEIKLKLLNNSFTEMKNCIPDILIVIDNNSFTKKEELFLTNYEIKLRKSEMVLYEYDFKGVRYEFFVKLDKLKNLSKKSGLSELDVLDFIVSNYMKVFKMIFILPNLITSKYKYDFAIERLIVYSGINTKDF